MALLYLHSALDLGVAEEDLARILAMAQCIARSPGVPFACELDHFAPKAIGVGREAPLTVLLAIMAPSGL